MLLFVRFLFLMHEFYVHHFGISKNSEQIDFESSFLELYRMSDEKEDEEGRKISRCVFLAFEATEIVVKDWKTR